MLRCLLEGGAYLRSGTYQRKYGIYKANNWFLPAITIQIIQLFLSHSLTLGLSLSNETEAKMQRGSWSTAKEKKLLLQTSTNSKSHGSSKRVQESRKLKILAFYTELGKSNTVFTSVLTLVSLKGNAREKIYQYFYSKWYFIID